AGVSPELERIVTKLLERDPEHRYQSAKELGADLRRLAAPAATATAVLPADGRDRHGWLLAAGGLVAALLVAGAVVPHWEWRDRLFGKRSTTHIESLAVLPLENMSRDPDQEYFADGMTDELTTSLAHISALRVISRTSVMQYKGTKKPLPEIARELNVDAVVEGSVLRSGNRVRITAQLIEATTDRHLWADTYERDLGDVLALQDEVSRSIARQIQVTLTPQEQAHLTTARPVNPEAHEAYLKGRYYASRRSAEDIQKASAYFQQAVDKDPAYAPAYAGLAFSYDLLPRYGRVSPLETLPKAKAAAVKALELDDGLAEAHVAMGSIKQIADWDWPGTEAEFKRALELAPGDAQAHYLYAFTYLAPQGRFDEAIAEMKRALQLDPLSLITNTNLGQILFWARRYDAAMAQCRKTMELDGRFGRAHSVLGNIYLQEGMYREAAAEFRGAAQYSPTSPQPLVDLASAYAMSGNKAEAGQILAELQKRSTKSYVSPSELAMLYVALDEKEQALASLEKAYEVHAGSLPYANVNPRFDSLRAEPRFQQLMRRIGLRPEDSPAAHVVSGTPKAPPAK
ncbi:MAG: tetratricopeptide repeat protein, partial [Acidobacteriota bacterium]|nr:tetratricopeptide repeat protein [Acidobacteriota bacterium]